MDIWEHRLRTETVFPCRGDWDYRTITPKRRPEMRQQMLTPQIQKKLFLMWSLISTPARPTPRKVAGTTGLMKVAQLRQTTMAMAV